MSFLNVIKGVAVVSAVSAVAYGAVRAYKKTVDELERQKKEAEAFSKELDEHMKDFLQASSYTFSEVDISFKTELFDHTPIKPIDFSDLMLKPTAESVIPNNVVYGNFPLTNAAANGKAL